MNALRPRSPLLGPVPIDVSPSAELGTAPPAGAPSRHSVFEHGVARFRCEGRAREHLVPFSCKGRGFCPSCGGRRMTERAAHLVDEVVPRVPVRQWFSRCRIGSATRWRGITG
jgi:hypothetical protein